MPFLLEKYGESKKTFYSGVHLAYPQLNKVKKSLTG